ncbi:CLUMA_CG000601, isoform A [Clunio marinus]|uniref:CLUMA_CG000601, isoform A n=1 Tax=Clunio marinus TaxID=568069 RepID=A0A1J1HKK1_9DIPT|nr:CLUMA_CG000601, isoform A [Clunio marinus]
MKINKNKSETIKYQEVVGTIVYGKLSIQTTDCLVFINLRKLIRAFILLTVKTKKSEVGVESEIMSQCCS